MTKSTITRERLAKIKSWRETYGAGSNVMLPAEEAEELARIALAAMDSSESVELPLDYLQGHKDGLEWAARLAEANHPDTGDWLYDDPIELAKAIRKGPDMPPAQPVADSEPVAWTWHYREQWHVTNDERRASFVAKDGDVAVLPLYRHAQQPVVPEENNIGSKNALDAIVSFIKGKSNPTVKCYEEVSEQLFKDNYHGIHSHVIEYILKLGEELEDLRAEQAEMQPVPVVPDDVLKALQKVARIRLDMDGFDGDRRGIADCLCDAEEALIEVVNRRAAMFNHPEQHLDMVDHSGDVNEKGGDGNSQVIPDGWTCNDKANAALMMLDRIETVDPVDDDRIDGIKRIVRELAAARMIPPL
ncbi:hypothetical protein [Klebsiella pneumoniae]|uniref:hypothetical protein n=1 Tax=Klebsiella pneumoniae TaxID=573 RepID=UPI0022B72781|nr:hypothetical protein [Klebsiella pneumoniae]